MTSFWKRIKWQIDYVADFLRWLFIRDSNSACLMIIDVAESLNRKQLREMRDYLDSLEKLRELDSNT